MTPSEIRYHINQLSPAERRALLVSFPERCAYNTFIGRWFDVLLANYAEGRLRGEAVKSPYPSRVSGRHGLVRRVS